MAHARRKLFEVFQATKSPIAEEALQRIAALYAIEAEINGQPAPQRLTERQARSKPLLDVLHGWIQAQRRRLPGKSALGRVMQYALNRWDALAHYLEDGRLSINNNLSERLLRGVAVTRKNFCSWDSTLAESAPPSSTPSPRPPSSTASIPRPTSPLCSTASHAAIL
jgi:transposase